MLKKDKIGFGSYNLTQSEEGFRYGIDAVLLADFSDALHKDMVADLGTGSGVIPLIIDAKYSPKSITAIEKQEEYYKLARQNFSDNGVEDRIKAVCCDVLDIPSLFPAESFTLVVSNPPYFEKGKGPESPDPAKHAARTETTAGINDFAAAAAYLLPKGGRFCLIHRPSRLADIFQALRDNGLEPKKMRMVCPFEGEPGNLVLIEAVKGAGRELKVLPQLVVRDKNNNYTDEINLIYNRR